MVLGNPEGTVRLEKLSEWGSQGETVTQRPRRQTVKGRGDIDVHGDLVLMAKKYKSSKCLLPEERLSKRWYGWSLGFPCGPAGKEPACNAGDLGSIPKLGRSSGEGKGYPLQSSGLENSMDCSLPGSSIHGIHQARILKWVAISFSRGSPWPRDQTCICCIERWILYHWATREAHL